MGLGTNDQRFERTEALFCDHQSRRQKAFMDGDVRALRMLNPPFVRVSIAGVRERQPVPFEDEAYGPI